MSGQQREMSGALFKNENPKSDRAPRYTGTCTIDGKEYRIAAWLKDGRNGTFMSLQFSVPEQRQQSGGSQQSDESDGGFF